VGVARRGGGSGWGGSLGLVHGVGGLGRGRVEGGKGRVGQGLGGGCPSGEGSGLGGVLGLENGVGGNSDRVVVLLAQIVQFHDCLVVQSCNSASLFWIGRGE
jgi:hypothetical protein